MKTPDQLVYYKLHLVRSDAAPEIEFSLQIESDFSWKLHYCGLEVLTENCSLLANLPPLLSCASLVEKFFTLLSSSRPCVGNSDERFLALLSHRDGGFRDCTSMISYTLSFSLLSTYLNMHVGNSVVACKESRILSIPTIRHAKCELLCSPSVKRCTECTHYRKTLHTSCSKQSHQSALRSHPGSCVNYRFLSKDELNERLPEVHSLQHYTTKKLERLQSKIAASVEKNGVDLDKRSHEDIQKIMEQCSEVLSKHPPDNFPHIFWQQQLQSASLTHSRQRRWHPLMIKWALYLSHQSGKAYETLRESGCIALPSQRTLRDYTYFLNSTMGFSDDVDKHLMEIAKLGDLQDFQKCIALGLGVQQAFW